jgi:hypothetical protein
MKIKNLLLIGLLLFGTVLLVPLNAQEEEGGSSGAGKYGTGEDSINCLKNLSLYRQYARQKNYTEALPFWQVVFNTCPLSSKNIYIDGVSIYRWFAEKEKDAVKRDLYIDTLMIIYDARIKYFGERGSVLSRKGIDLLRYRRNDQKYIEEGYNILDESIGLLKSKSSAPAFATYFTAAVSLYKLNVLDAGKIVGVWGNIIPLIEDASVKNPKDTTYASVKNSIMANFINSGAATPASLTKYYEPLLKASPENIVLLKEITSGFVNIGAEDDPFYIHAAELQYAKEPSADAAYKLAKLLIKKEQFQKASDYYKEAIEKVTDNELKAKYYYEEAGVTARLDNISMARTYALNAIKFKENWGDPYLLIAKLYANSSANCGSKEIEKKSVFWAAVDKCNKAKSVDPNVAEEANSLINTYSSYFPNREEAFFEGYTDGQTYQVGCWIGESTIVRTKK